MFMSGGLEEVNGGEICDLGIVLRVESGLETDCSRVNNMIFDNLSIYAWLGNQTPLVY